MMYVFNPCPDCGHYEEPYIYRDVVRDHKGDMIDSTVKAVCRNCEWETQGHKNVRGCANDWNKSGAYPNHHLYTNLTNLKECEIFKETYE